jgi:hypothetical protein
MNFWPDDIKIDEALAPRDIMEEAGQELTNRTQNKLEVTIIINELDDRSVLAFEVMNTDSLAVLNLFEVSYQKENFYPLVISPPKQDIPEFLRRQRIVKGTIDTFQTFADIARMTERTRDRVIENPWVCATPTEFKEKLKMLFHQEHVKARIMNLLMSEGIAERPNPKVDNMDVDTSVPPTDNES